MISEIYLIMLFYALFFSCFVYCSSKDMSNYKLLAYTPITRLCPHDLEFLFKVYEKHPSMEKCTKCCATRLNERYMLTEKGCFKMSDPRYVTLQSCNKKVEYQAQKIISPAFDNGFNDVSLILIVDPGKDILKVYYNTFYVEDENYKLDWKQKQFTVYGITLQRKQEEVEKDDFFEQWKTISSNNITIQRCYPRNSSSQNKWLCPERTPVQICNEDIGCPMMYTNKLIGIASQRYNWRTWATNMECGNVDVETKYLYLKWKYVKWIKSEIMKMT